MIYSVIAGFMIGIGGMVNLKIGSIAGAVFFSVGLLTILHFKLNLFTGKAGLLITDEIKPMTLVGIWFGNLIGALAAGFCTMQTPVGMLSYDKAVNIVETRVDNGNLANLILGILCGVLMYAAVTGYKETGSAVFVALPVATFILAGFNHCVADMFYLSVGAESINDWWCLIPTTIGNLIGCNLIPTGKLLTTRNCG